MATGMAALQRKKAMMAQKRRVGQELAEETMSKMREALDTFRRNLERFALAHREEIRHDPEFRAHFHAMCAHCGVDPLASNKARVNKLLDFRDWSFATFYYELGVSVVEVCMTTRPRNGGLIELGQLTRLVQTRRGRAVDKVTEDDVLQAVKRLRALDSSFTVIPDPKTARVAKGTVYYVNSVPREVDMNLQDVLEAARERGWVSVESLAQRPTWGRQRAAMQLQASVKEGTCMVDDGDPGGGASVLVSGRKLDHF